MTTSLRGVHDIPFAMSEELRPNVIWSKELVPTMKDDR